jgi:Zn-dependent protease
MDLTPDTLALGLAWYAVFLFSTTCHEAAHAWAALRLGDTTAYEGGQVSLNPLPHVRRSPFGMVLVPILSFFLGGWMVGWASAPYDPTWAYNYPRRSGWMSLAGPATNFALVLISGLLIRAGILFGWFYAPERVGLTEVTAAHEAGLAPVASLLGIFFGLNLLLFLFNLLPVPPLDGSGGLNLLLPESAARNYQEFIHSQPGLSLLGLVVAWKLFSYVFGPLQLLAINLLYPGMGYG